MAAEQKIERLRYPLHEEDDYKACVFFTLFSEEKTGGVGETLGSLASNKIQKLRDQYKQAVADENYELAEEIAGQTKETIREAEQLRSQLKEHEGDDRQPAVKATTRVNKTAVKLYLPPGLAYRDNVQYENFDLGPVGATVAAGVGVAASAVEGTKSFLENFKASFGSNPTDLAKLAAIRAAGALAPSSSGIESGLKLQGGVTVNPNTRTLFKGVNIREFSFAFKMIARSAEEALEIKKIIRFFRSEIYPESIDAVVGGKSVSLGYIFPNKFDIKIKYAGKNNAPVIKPCYLRDVTTTFNSTSMAMHQDGEFLEVDLILAFQETAALVKKDILDDPYYQGIQ